MKKFSKFICTLLIALTVALSAFTAAAASPAASLKGPSTFYQSGDLKLELQINGNGEKAVSGTLKYDQTLLNFQEIKTASGWKIEYNRPEVGGKIYFTAVDAGNKNPVKGTKTVVTFTFSKEFLEVGDKTTVTATNLEVSAGKATKALANAKWSGKLLETPSDDDDSGYTIGDEEPDEIAPDAKGDVLDEIRLSRLLVAEGVLTPEFAPDVKNYKLTVPADCDKLTITAIAKNSKSKVTITGAELTGNKSIATIVVEGESGSKRTYKIYVQKERSKGVTGTGSWIMEYLWAFILGGVALLLLIIGFILFIIIKRKKKKDQEAV